MYPVNIEAVVNGYIVSVGCKRFVFTDLAHLVDELKFYLTSPDEAEKLWRENFPKAFAGAGAELLAYREIVPTPAQQPQPPQHPW